MTIERLLMVITDGNRESTKHTHTQTYISKWKMGKTNERTLTKYNGHWGYNQQQKKQKREKARERKECLHFKLHPNNYCSKKPHLTKKKMKTLCIEMNTLHNTTNFLNVIIVQKPHIRVQEKKKIGCTSPEKYTKGVNRCKWSKAKLCKYLLRLISIDATFEFQRQDET